MKLRTAWLLLESCIILSTMVLPLFRHDAQQTQIALWVLACYTRLRVMSCDAK